jgi:hypothetical protein
MIDLLPAKRRSSARRHFRPHCRAIDWRDFSLIGERLIDVSAEGCVLACDVGVEIGDELLVTFRMPWLGPHVLVTAEVTRVIEGLRAGDPGYCAGLHFLDLDRDERAELARRLAMLEPTAPMRPHPIDYASTVRALAHEVPPDVGLLVAELGLV